MLFKVEYPYITRYQIKKTSLKEDQWSFSLCPPSWFQRIANHCFVYRQVCHSFDFPRWSQQWLVLCPCSSWWLLCRVLTSKQTVITLRQHWLSSSADQGQGQGHHCCTNWYALSILVIVTQFVSLTSLHCAIDGHENILGILDWREY